ncbi:MAG: flagellar biosynthetic protein FliR [Sulfuritalea sp.]|jgi:flagellar biosynthetic protein FliR|nr:flagellar biosynthetic protein FliR [Sulfuritalea sp.]
MNLLAADIVERFYTFLWPMLRISALLMSAPIFSLRALNVRMRVLLAAALTWMVYPLYTWPALDPVSGAGMVEVFNQISIGLIMGLSLQVITAAIVLAGQSVSTAMGLSMASLMDPNLGNVPVISQFMLIFSTLIFVGLGGHAMLLGLVIDSFASMPIGKGLLTAGAWAQFVKWSSMIFLGAVLLALPVMVTMLFINIGIGVVTRAAPSLNIFSLGLPVMIVAGFFILVVALPSMGARIEWLWLQGFVQVRGQLGQI